MDYKRTSTMVGGQYAMLVLCWMFGLGYLSAQEANKASLRHALTYKLMLTDYNSLDLPYQASNPGRFFHFEDINYAAALGYHYRLRPSVQLGAVLQVGSMDSHHIFFVDEDSLCQPCQRRIRDELFVGLDIVGEYHFANGYLLPENYWLAPYVVVGIGAVYMNERKGNWDVQLPMGIGLNIHFSRELALQLQTAYRLSLGIQRQSLAFSAGLFWQLGRVPTTE